MGETGFEFETFTCLVAKQILASAFVLAIANKDCTHTSKMRDQNCMTILSR
jgi:hypothetical protein